MEDVCGKRVVQKARLNAAHLLIFGSDNGCFGAGAPLVAPGGQQAPHQGVQAASQHAAHQPAIGGAH